MKNGLGPWGFVLRLHPLIWAAFAVLYLVLDTGRQPDPDLLGLGVRAVWWAAIGCLATVPLVVVYGRWRLVIGDGYALPTVLAGIAVASVVWTWAFQSLDGLLAIEDGFVPLYERPFEELFAELTDAALIVLAWHGLSLALVERERVFAAEASAAEAKHAELQRHLSPHFLFNALNAVAALIPTDPTKAEKAVVLISGILREALQKDAPDLIPLAEELELEDQYLAMEQLRFGANLECKVQMPGECAGLLVPRLVLQPLLENAVKFGLASGQRPATVSVVADRSENLLTISISNPGSIDEMNASPEKGSGRGLGIVRARLLSYDAEARLEVLEAEGQVAARASLRTKEAV